MAAPAVLGRQVRQTLAREDPDGIIRQPSWEHRGTLACQRESFEEGSRAASSFGEGSLRGAGAVLAWWVVSSVLAL